MLLYAIFPLDRSVVYQPMTMKADGGASAIIVFRSEQAARSYVESNFDPVDFAIGELTIEQFDSASRNAREHLGIETYIRILD